MTKYAAFFEASIQRNGGVGFSKSPSIADIGMKTVADAISSGNWDHIDPKFFEKYPGILATAKMVDENEAIKAYNASK